ncbi:hypothetical protein N8814_05350 [Acidimicrobiia bacterium]|nr:hypothetical protein [Acidimicrobiia bacterium]
MAKEKDYIPGSPPGSQGPTFENFDTAYEVDQIQKMATESDRANLADINKQIAAADKELARLAGRVSPLARPEKQKKKFLEYESKVIDTRRFLESEKEAITKILEEKKEMLPQSYSSAVEEKNIARKTIQGPPQIKQAPIVQGPKYSVKFDVMEAVTMGIEPAPAREPAKPKPTPIGKITANKETGKINYPEMKVGTTGTGKPIMSTGPAREYLSERMLKSDADIAIEHKKVGADYQERVIQEQIKMEKLEFDFDEGVTRSVSGDEFERVSTQEMFARSSGTKDRVVVPANEANKAADIRAGMSIGDRAKYDAKIARDKAIEDKVKARQALQDAEIRKRGNRQLTGTGLESKDLGTPFKVKPPESKIKDKPKSSGSFEISSAAKAAAAAKVAKAMKNLGGKTNVLNIPIMTKGSADKIFKDFFGKQDYSS